ncbi:serine protease inhibitor 42Dd [Eurosta solidaginis]|uniref:serine protease inhibitor 42Dd n=1 Tax=Eurosta solidaginis TaxID=178769 RepID=UPI0035313CE7
MRAILLFTTSLLLMSAGLPALAATVGGAGGGQGEATEHNLFAADIYQAVAVDHLTENVVISPAAIQTAMALAFFGAKGRTANEIQAGARLGSANSDEVVRRFSTYQTAFTRSNNLRLFNKIYINENLEFKANFRDAARRSFDSDLETADFHPPYNKRTADRISKEVEQKTLNKVTNILQPQQLNDLTEGVMVIGVAYSAPWLNAFKVDKTEKREFSSGGRQTVNVDMMWTVNNFRYAEVSELDAKVIELPYQNSEYAMLVLLPNQMNGLANLVQRLVGKNLVGLVESHLSTQKIEVRLPKFGFEFGVSLEQPFRKLGITTMFTRHGDFGNMYRMFVSHYINSANHKAYVEVNEEGSVPSLESGGRLKSLLSFSRPKSIEVDHPFVFAIKHEHSIIFLGHVTFNV